MKFAGPLKSMTREFLAAAGVPAGDIERMVEGDLKEAPIAALGSITPRRIMETIGTDWGRKTITEGLWTDVAEARIRALMADGKSVVVDDMRFPNEFDLIERMGGRTVRIERRGRTPTAMEGRLNGHFFDYYVTNDGTRQEFRDVVDHLVTRLRA
ncbi:hypothetical protein AncyloWKF20_07555 [Ancylobacter sp. WKF20]|uniref:deoxynucleotide monophosphate kinase family protein n=1 Tax=Ancylobacter sp. WKF20 TaxID=3039801 RepID=UPI0024344ADB|nr:hypothetical protein [Ancylobacter sp. WKF20]WGD31665.1 hypothetical protein AncyloWKF20_07555 [Ancylobacter sp. WKF20]